ncbi:MAG: hypothetical protein V1787_00955 [Candidatus Micrarchaeota archaeon]
MLFADLHLHSKYSRAVSPNMDLEHLEEGARRKGLGLLGTADFTHPLWFAELRRKLEETGAGTGIYRLRNSSSSVRFILQTEISTIFSDGSAVKKVHHIVFAPSLESAGQLNDRLAGLGSLSADGRPTFGRTTPAALVELCRETDRRIEVVPAHCLTPDTLLHVREGLKAICEVVEGEAVFTHSNNWRAVQRVFKRRFDGKIFRVTPFYFREGLAATPEHPFFAIRGTKCSWTNGLSRPTCLSKPCCRKFEGYRPEWVRAKDLSAGDVLIYPRFNSVRDKDSLLLSEYVSNHFLAAGKILPMGTRRKPIPNLLAVDAAFCRIAGYYLAEGSINSNGDSISFTFNKAESEYLDDVNALMKQVFGLEVSALNVKSGTNSAELVYYSKILAEAFKKLFYSAGSVKRAPTKKLPPWMLEISTSKQAELLRCWWRGDGGYTVSRVLASQMKIVCLRLGIIPSIAIERVDAHNSKRHLLSGRTVFSRNDLFHFSNLSFFEDPFLLLRDSAFRKFNTTRKTRHGWMDKNYAYLPIRNIAEEKYCGDVYNLEVAEDNSYVCEWAAVHNCWTPWFSVFGSNSGYDSIGDAYGDESGHIRAFETGMSSDPPMNWRVSALDKYAQISNSDSHSPYPFRIGREANAFNLPAEGLTYASLFDAIYSHDPGKFAFTVEVDPNYGKYHFDGHRNCKFSCPPEESLRLGNRCPACKRPLTIGVLNRVGQLADRPPGIIPQGAIPFKTLLPLQELVAAVYGSTLASRKVFAETERLTAKFGTEFNLLLETPAEVLRREAHDRLASAILANRAGRLKVRPGFDGEYGVLELDPSMVDQPEKRQTGLMDY